MKTHLNLLPRGYQRGQVVRRCLYPWSTVAVLLALIISGLAWSNAASYRKSTIKLESLEREWQPAQRMRDEMVTIRKRLEELQQREALVLELAAEESMLTMMGILSQATLTADSRIGIRRCQLQRRSGDRLLTLEGLAVDHFSVAAFAGALRESDAFTRVELKSTGRQQIAQRDAQTFVIECVF